MSCSKQYSMFKLFIDIKYIHSKGKNENIFDYYYYILFIRKTLYNLNIFVLLV